MEELYHAALEKSGEEREALLAESDPEVRRGVEALLAQGTSGEKVLDRPAWEQVDDTLEVAPAAQFAPGEQLGPYRIEARVGAGGMGEVYRARDTRLNRLVAIKVSAAQFSERFGREARAIASLNHPNICQADCTVLLSLSSQVNSIAHSFDNSARLYSCQVPRAVVLSIDNEYLVTKSHLVPVSSATGSLARKWSQFDSCR